MLLLRQVLDKFRNAPGPKVVMTRDEYQALCSFYGAISTVPHETFMGKWIHIDDTAHSSLAIPEEIVIPVPYEADAEVIEEDEYA